MMELDSYREASNIEEINPRKALGIYTNLQKRNFEFHHGIFLAKVAFPLTAAVIAFFAAQFISRYQSLVAVLIFCLVGFGPPGFIQLKAQLRPMKVESSASIGPMSQLFTWGLNVVLPLFSGLIQLFFMAIIAVIIGMIVLMPVSLFRYLLTEPPFLWPWELPNYIARPVIWVCFIPVFLISITDVMLTPFFPMKRILYETLVGIKAKLRRIIYFFASLAIGLIVLEVLYSSIRLERIPVYLTVVLVAGLVFGFVEAPVEKDKQFGLLCQIAKARCLFRLNRLAEAGYLMRRIVQEEKSNSSYAVRCLGHVLLTLVYRKYGINDRDDVGGYIDDASEWMRSNDRLREIYLDSVQKIRVLTGIAVKSEAGPDRSYNQKYTGIGRVIATGYECREGTNVDEYDKDNPTGYCTGQWINVEVVDGVMYFNGPHYPGETIEGIWSYGGDTGIAGKPKVGDRVGYYEDGYCKIWEKI